MRIFASATLAVRMEMTSHVERECETKKDSGPDMGSIWKEELRTKCEDASMGRVRTIDKHGSTKEERKGIGGRGGGRDADLC